MPAKKQSEEIVVLKVRNNRKSIKIVYKQGADTIDRDFHDMPLPAFYKAIEALAPHVCTLAEFPAKDVDKIVATGITCSENGDNTDALIVARKKIKKGSRILNVATPLLPMYPDEENKSADCMEPEEAKAIEKVLKETMKYLAGERAQGQINFIEDEGDKKKDEGDGKSGEQLPFEPKAESANA
jgi:hypothetical protein